MLFEKNYNCPSIHRMEFTSYMKIDWGIKILHFQGELQNGMELIRYIQNGGYFEKIINILVYNRF